MASKMLSLELLVDKETSRVVLAESGRDFVDVLFSFLTLPLGTVLRLLGEQHSSLGRAAELYKSVEGLDVSFFQRACCKDMLLRPRSSAERCCDDLPLKVDSSDLAFYTCWDKSCIEKDYSSCVYSAVKGARCRCLGDMDRRITWEGSREEGDYNGVFVEVGGRFTISDDVCVSLVSASTILTLFDRCGCKEGNALEPMKVQLAREQVLTLLEKSISSKTPLTEMFLQKHQCEETDVVSLQQKDEASPRNKLESTTCGREFKARLVGSKSRNKVLYAVVGEDVVDLVFSFLTIPLGSIIRLLEKDSHVGCMDNLYKSVEKLRAIEYCAKLEQHKDMLLAPKIAPFFGCSNQLLEVNEADSCVTTMNACACLRCAKIPAPTCIHGKKTVRAEEINPKMGSGKTEKGGGFAKGRPGTFMITDEMVVMLNSSFSAIQIMSDAKIPVNDVEEREVTLGEKEALDLLRALLLSRTPLTDVFCHGKEKPLTNNQDSTTVDAAWFLQQMPNWI